MKNQNLPKCRIVTEFFYKTPIREFFEVFKRIAQLGSKLEDILPKSDNTIFDSEYVTLEESRESFVQSVIKVGYKVEW